ncbi:hypothetical protein ACFX58_13455 [Sphingomonas sp. NCPPB 2930]
MPVKKDLYNETLDFYRNNLWFSACNKNADELESEKFPGISLTFTLKKKPQGKEENHLTMIFEKNLPTFCSYLKEKGVEFILKTDILATEYAVEFHDPSGNLIYARCSNIKDDNEGMVNLNIID